MVEEVVRWATPITSFQRTTVVDTVVGGVEIAKGDRLGLLYASATHDEAVFTDPVRFDITRDPTRTSPSAGPVCTGVSGRASPSWRSASRSRTSPSRCPTSRRPARPVRLRSDRANGIREFRVRYRP